MNIKKQEKCAERFVQLPRHKIPGTENSDSWSSKTRIPPLMTFISMSNDEKFNLCTSF